MESPSAELWQSLVDSFVEIGDGVHDNWIMEREKYPDVEENREINAFLASLSEPQRRVLTSMLIDARHGGVFDALVVLHERLVFNEGKYSERGVEMEIEPRGYTLFQDYVSRRSGDGWRE
jgi:hypothetical protein